VILATATDFKIHCPTWFGGLGLNGTLLVVGAGQGPIEASPLSTYRGAEGESRAGPGGIPTDSEDTPALRRNDRRPPDDRKNFPWKKPRDAYTRMRSGKAEFRVVLTM